MKLSWIVASVGLACSSTSFAVSSDTKAEQDRLTANVKTESQRFQKALKEVEQHMKAAKTQTPTKEDDAALLSAWKGQNSAMEDMINFGLAHESEFKAEDANFEARLQATKDGLASQKKLAALAETEGAVKVLNRFGENLRKEFAKAVGKVAVNAKSSWTNTGVAVKSGQIVHVEVNGTWTVSPKYNLFDADGIKAGGGFIDYRVYKGANLGAAICRVGVSDKVYGGKSQKFMADRDGDVQCRINDSDLGNNVGEVQVEFIKD
jgi:hypothetical protein